MASGDITKEYDERKSSLNCLKPVCGLTLEIVVPDGSSEAEVVLDEVDHKSCNCLITSLFLRAPAIATAGKTVRLELLSEDEDEIFTTGDLDATDAAKHSRHTQRSIYGKTGFKVICDANVTGAKTFYVGFRGL